MTKYIFFIFIFLANSLFAETIANSSLGSSSLKGGVSSQSRTIDTKNFIKVSLIDVVLETVSQSNNVKAAREKVRQAKIKVDDAYSGYLPSVDGRYKQGRTESKPGEDDEDSKFYNDKSYKLSITQNLYAGGATYTEIKSLEKKYDTFKNEYRLVIAKEIENAIKAYFDVLFNYQSLNINSENMKRLNEILEIVNIKYESGATSIGDLSNIKANVSNAKTKLVKIESKFNAALDYYTYIVGDDFAKTFPYEDKFDTTIEDFDLVTEKALQNNISLKNYKLNIESQKYKLQGSKSGFKPKVDLELSTEKITDQEDFIDIERNYNAKVVVSYNFYNKGRDKNKILLINSMIRELNYRLKEEIRKLKWTLSKLHTSIQSVTSASVSTKAEVLASQEMVNAYWDGFKLGEQDLQELLQGQRQLNSAQLDLVNNKKSAITDYFKLLSKTGELLQYFRLDVDQDNFIDFSRSDYKKLSKLDKDDILSKDLLGTTETEVKVIETKQEDINTTIVEDSNIIVAIEDQNLTQVRVETSLDQLVEYQDEFLQSDDDKWTIRIHYFDKVYQALDFANKKEINKKVFIFDTLDNNKVKTNIAYNVFDTKQLAQQSLNELNITQKTAQLYSIKDLKNLYEEFKNKQLQQKVKPKKVKPFQTNQKFKKEFLEAQSDRYTINITSFSSISDAKELLTKEKIYDKSFVFSYGEESEWVKVMYGVFETYEKASEALESLENIQAKYQPVIEIINNKQELYKKYNSGVKNSDDLIIEEEFIDQTISEDDNSTKTSKPKLILEPQERLISKEENFQEKFLSAKKNYYTLNLATLYNKKAVEKFIKRNKPRIEKIGIKQKLYFKYNSVEER